MNTPTFFQCKCSDEKKHRLTFDGGSSGQYNIDLCEKCNIKDDKSFLIHSQELM